MKLTIFVSQAFERKKKHTRRKHFLAEMEAVVPRAALPTTGRRGRPPMQDALYEIESMRRFAGLELSDGALPDETTILRFRNLLEKHGLTAQMMNIMNDTLKQRGLLLKEGSRVDVTVIHGAPSTKKQDKKRDPGMHQPKKGNQCYFRKKIHLCADDNSGLVHTVSVTPANASDVGQLPHLLREDDRALFGDKEDINNAIKRGARKTGVLWCVSLKARKKRPLNETNSASITSCPRSARVEHVFRVIKRQLLHAGAPQGDREERRADVLVDRVAQSRRALMSSWAKSDRRTR